MTSSQSVWPSRIRANFRTVDRKENADLIALAPELLEYVQSSASKLLCHIQAVSKRCGRRTRGANRDRSAQHEDSHSHRQHQQVEDQERQRRVEHACQHETTRASGVPTGCDGYRLRGAGRSLQDIASTSANSKATPACRSSSCGVEPPRWRSERSDTLLR